MPSENLTLYCSGQLTFNLLVVSLGEVEHRPGGTLRRLAKSVPCRVFADADQDAAVAVGELGQRLARRLLGPSTPGSSSWTPTIMLASKWTLVNNEKIDLRSGATVPTNTPVD